VTERPTGSTAATTKFCAAEVQGPDGVLWVDGNGKITAGNGTLLQPSPNAFSIRHVQDCPGSTAECRASCYVHQLAAAQPALYALYEHNSSKVRSILAGQLSDVWARVMAEWVSEHCRGGFRWHVSGDVFSGEYAGWIARVCQLSPSVQHWIYTRSFQYLGSLRPVSTVVGGNLAVNLSADRENWEAARRASLEHGFRVCYMTLDGFVPGDVGGGDVIFPDYSLRGGNPEGQRWFSQLPPEQKRCVCPVDYSGKSENRRCGPCDRCLT